MNADRDGSIPFRFARDHFRLLPLPSRVRDHPHKEEESDLPQTTSMCSYERIRLANTRISRASPSRGRSRKSCARVENTQKYGQIQRKNKQILLPMEPKYRPRARSTLHPHPRDFFLKIHRHDPTLAFKDTVTTAATAAVIRPRRPHDPVEVDLRA